jgi:hypothetical protein
MAANGDADAPPNVRYWRYPEWSLLDQSGQRWILARDGLVANDPKRTLGPAQHALLLRPNLLGFEPTSVVLSGR